MKKTKNYILAPVLIASILFLQLPSFALVKAEDETTIETGQVNVQVETDNTVNTNSTEVEQPVDNQESSQTQEPSGPVDDKSQEQNQEPKEQEVANENNQTQGQDNKTANQSENEGDDQLKLENTNQNEAKIENSALVEGESGENKIENNNGNSSIDTGDVNVIVGIFNTANSNFTGSAFSQFLLNILSNLEGDINLQDKINSSSAGLCEGCLELNIQNTNDGSIKNEINIDGSSGSNEAESKTGNAKIKTGDVNVAASIFNLLNTNFVGSNWQSFIVNVFSNWTGDLVLPGKDKMQQLLGSLSQSGACQNCSLSADNSSQGDIKNKVDIKSDTGENIAVGDATFIRTGESGSQTNVLNVANTNITGGSWFFMVINTFGKWKGNIFNLPSELKISGDSDSIKIYDMDLGDPDSLNGGLVNVLNDNTGLIENSIIINASSGSNKALAPNGEASVETGNTNVLANLLNFLNTNIIGSNWLLGIINVFGDWMGSLSFGKPDLWVGSSASTPSNPVIPGETITYTLTYINNGDADASEVILTDDFDENYLRVIDYGGGTSNKPGEIQWDIGDIPIGSSGSVSYSVVVNPEMPEGNTNVTSLATIDSYENDWNQGDNVETISVKVRREILWSYGPKDGAMGEVLKITKKSKDEDGVALAGSNVDYQIVLFNNSFSNLYDVVLEDVLINESISEVFNNSGWNLGQVFPWEQITIDYSVAFGSEVPPGVYKNTAKATGRDAAGNLIWSGEVSNNINLQSYAEPANHEQETKEDDKEEVAMMDMKNQLDGIQIFIKNMVTKTNENNLTPAAANADDGFPKEPAYKVLGQEESIQGEKLPLLPSGQQEQYSKNFLAAISLAPLNIKLMSLLFLVITLGLTGLWLFYRKKKS